MTLKNTHSDRTCLKYQDALRQQLKTFSERCSNGWESVDVPNSEDEKPKKQALNCQPVTARHEQADSRTKTPKVLESVSCSGKTDICGSCSTVGNTTVTDECTPEARENAQSIDEAGCHVRIVDSDRCIAQPCNNRLVVNAHAGCFEAVPTAGAVKKKKKKKTVTFSDNVELVASAGDKTDPVDYMSYAASIGRQANSSCTAMVSATDPLPDTVNGVDTPSNCSGNCDVIATDGSEETDVGNSVIPTGQARCSLCRQKWVALTDTYCSDCSFYLSKLEMSN